jgi:UPF0716 family protein affecting phage T7 exclusion
MSKIWINWLHIAGCVVLGLFFVNAGVKKFVPKNRPVKPEMVVAWQQAVTDNRFESPVSFQLTMASFRQSGFFKMIGVLQLLSAVLLLIPRTRRAGLLLLLPVTINIFTMHLFMDNRMDENIETGLVLMANLLLLLPYVRPLWHHVFGETAVNLKPKA